MRYREWMPLGWVGAACLALVVGAAVWFYGGGKPGVPETTASMPEATFTAAELAERLAHGDADALAAFRQRVVADAEQGKSLAVSGEHFDDMVALLQGAGLGYARFGTMGRATLAGLSGGVLDRLAVEPAPAAWTRALEPIQQVLSQALSDGEVQVRIAALGATYKLWNWGPGRAALPVEEDLLGTWKEAFHSPVQRLLIDPESQVRAAAVLNFGQIPIDSLAMPAAVRVADVAPEVRRQVLTSFAKRPAVLTEDDILPRLHDDEPSLVLMAKFLLDQRGLTEAQIELGSQVFHPNPAVRKSVVGQLGDREDIDPIVWLVHLSRDPNETVRGEALKAMTDRATSPDVLKRLTEMAVDDPSRLIRDQARKLLPAEAAALLPPFGGGDATVAIPPLPGSPSLNPKAN